MLQKKSKKILKKYLRQKLFESISAFRAGIVHPLTEEKRDLLNKII